MARRARWDSTKQQYCHDPVARRPLIIIYPHSCVEEPVLWQEVKMACDFARALTEGVPVRALMNVSTPGTSSLLAHGTSS